MISLHYWINHANDCAIKVIVWTALLEYFNFLLLIPAYVEAKEGCSKDAHNLNEVNINSHTHTPFLSGTMHVLKEL